MTASIGLIEVGISIFKLLKYLSYVKSDFDRGCGRLHGLMRASMQGSLAVNVAVRFK